jgi:hypothetical protein
MKTNKIKSHEMGAEFTTLRTTSSFANDGLYRILKVPMEDGTTFEVVQERTIHGEYMTRLRRMRRDDEISIVNYHG